MTDERHHERSLNQPCRAIAVWSGVYVPLLAGLILWPGKSKHSSFPSVQVLLALGSDAPFYWHSALMSYPLGP
jgi:hypothetical protein